MFTMKLYENLLLLVLLLLVLGLLAVSTTAIATGSGVAALLAVHGLTDLHRGGGQLADLCLEGLHTGVVLHLLGGVDGGLHLGLGGIVQLLAVLRQALAHRVDQAVVMILVNCKKQQLEE